MNSGRRQARPQLSFEVVGTERLSASLVRIWIGGSAFGLFVTGADPARLAATDRYAKLWFTPSTVDLEPPYDFDLLRQTLEPDQLPVSRTYTVRAVDDAEKVIAIDFFVHGDEGIAGRWATTAEVGDRVVLSGPGGQYSPPGGDLWHLLAGDESAIPAIASALEALDGRARGLALIEVDSAEDEIPLSPPEGVDVRWLHRASADGADGGQPGNLLVAAVGELNRPSGDIDVFAHGEREAMKALRPLFVSDWEVNRRALSLSAYWAQGRTEDRFQAEKRQPVGRIFDDQ